MFTTSTWSSDWLAPPYVYIILGGILSCAILYRLFLRPFYFSPMRKIPGPPLGHPVYGQFEKMNTEEPGILHMQWAEDHGPAIRFIGPFGSQGLLFLDPPALERILVSNVMNFPRPAWRHHILGITVGYGLLTATGNSHKLMRKTLNPAFSLSNLNAQTDMYYPPLEKLVKILSTQIAETSDPKEGTQIITYDWLSKVTLDIICATAFDYHPDAVSKADNELFLAIQQLINLGLAANIVPFIGFMKIPGVPALLRSKFALKYREYLFIGSLKPVRHMLLAAGRIKAVCRQLLEKKLLKENVQNSESKKDILTLLVRARLDDKHEGYKMSDVDLMEQMRTFLAAGHETTASGATWTLWLLAQNPDCQKRLREEVLPLIRQHPRPDYRSLKELSYLDAVIMESLRLFPPVPYAIREAQQDDYIDGHYISKGTSIIIPIRAINTWTKIWGSDAKVFHPERWFNLPPTYNSTFSFMSFFAGPRTCIGRTMAIMELKAMITILIAYFSFEPGYEGQVAHPTGAVTMKPRDGLPLKVKWVGTLPLPINEKF